MGEQSVWIPMSIPSVANLREHWAKRSGRAAKQRGLTAMVLYSTLQKPEPPLIIELTRVAPRRLDSDNLWSAFKAVRDGVADWLGVDDGDEQVTYRCEQAKSKYYDGFKGVHITVRNG